MVGGDKRTGGSGSWNLNLLSVSESILWRMSVEPRILVYEGRRFLRPETGPKVVGAKETGFGNLPRLAIASIGTAVFMIGSGVWFANKLRSGEIPWDSPWKWFALAIMLVPMFFFMGLVLLQAKKKPVEKPKLPPNPIYMKTSLYTNKAGTVSTGSLELQNGLIRVVGEKQTIEINRLEVESIKLVEGRVRLVIPKHHALPAMHIFLSPINEELGNMLVKREVLKELASRIESMPTSTLASTYPRIEFREFQRPPGTLAKCIVGGGTAGLGISALMMLLGRPSRQDPGSDALLLVIPPLCLATLVVVIAFGDVWVAKSNNKWLRKKGILRD